MRAVLDACVLYPTVPRLLLLGCARAGLITPLWSDRILEEWRRAVLRTHPDQAATVALEIAQCTAAFPNARTAAAPDVEARLSLPDTNDTHVLATAISGKAECLITFNMRDFPGRTLARDNVFPRHPDGVFLEVLEQSPETFLAIVDEAMQHLPAEMTQRAILKRARLPRLGKALAN